MQVIVEGPDGSGKTTLIREILRQSDWRLVPGQGPEKYPGEIDTRACQYLTDAENRTRMGGFRTCLFDRHPCVSHPIYSRYTQVTKLDPGLISRFYRMKNFFVYCRGASSFPSSHEVKARDSQRHLEAIRRNHTDIYDLYSEWGLHRGHFIYRLNDLNPAVAAGMIIKAAGEMQ